MRPERFESPPAPQPQSVDATPLRLKFERLGVQNPLATVCAANITSVANSTALVDTTCTYAKCVAAKVSDPNPNPKPKPNQDPDPNPNPNPDPDPNPNRTPTPTPTLTLTLTHEKARTCCNVA